jgi:hypothetical protein
MTSDYELEQFLEQTLAIIPNEYKDEQFSHINIVARSLKNVKKNPQEDLDQLIKYDDKLRMAGDKIVARHYKAFNKTIKSFSDICIQLEESQGEIEILSKELASVKEELTSRSEGFSKIINSIDISELYSTYLEQNEFLNILNLV